MVFPAPDVRPSPENIDAILRRTRVTSACMPPSFIENALNYEPALQSLARLKVVMYLGGPLNPFHGEKLARMVPGLCSLMGTTEGAGAHLVYPGNSSHWNAMKFVDLGQRMEEISPGIHELVFPRTELIHRTTGFFHSQPHLVTEYRTKDLFSRVEGQDSWWIYQGRADNWIAMSNGLKMDPTHIENTVSACPEVKGVVVAGEGHFRLCLLVELHAPVSSDDRTAHDVMQRIWPSIDEANSASPKFGRIPRELVLFATETKPFLRASKGTIQRRLTVQAYEGEIKDMYAQAEEGLLTEDLPAIVSTEHGHHVDFVTRLYADLLDVEEMGEHDDLLALGMDSLAAQTVVAKMKAALRKYGVDEGRLGRIDMRFVYTATTLSQMATKLTGVLSGSHEMEETAADAGLEDAIRLLQRYEDQILRLPKMSTGIQNSRFDGAKVVVLTGSTGSIGSYVLSWLLARSDVETVICLNRSADARHKQIMSLRSKGLPTLPEGEDRVRFMKTELSDARLGLGDGDYELVRQQATHFIHNAFPVNFLMTVRSFEPQVAALANLVHLACNGSRSPAFMFISSISAATPVSGDMGIVEEMVLSVDQARNLLPQGYAQAKFVCEHLLGTYAAHAGKKASILRVGQVCGPLSGTGTWDASEWFPSLVISSKKLGAAPDAIGPLVNWVPVDILGEIVSELLDGSQDSFERGVLVYNVVNPRPISWSQLVGALSRVVPAVISPAEWLSRLESSIDGRLHHPNQVVGGKLIDFYKAMLGQNRATKISVDHLVRHSQRAATLAPIDKGDIMRWMQAWKVYE
jgi:thioester reductase-like protein